jgi:hypothetical protein
MKTNILLFVLAALLAIPSYLTVRGERARFTEIKDVPLLFDGFNAKAVAFLRVNKGWNDPPPQGQQAPADQKPTPELVFQRTAADKWSLQAGELAGMPVLTPKIDSELLDHLGRIRRDERAVLRPKATPDEIKQFGLDKEQGFVIAAFDAQQRLLAELVVGKDVSAGQWGNNVVRGRYVRAKANDSVLVYETDFWNPTVEANEWLDLKVFQVDLNKAIGFKLFNPTTKEPVEFSKDKPQAPEWQVVKQPDGTADLKQGDLGMAIPKMSFVQARRVLAPFNPTVLQAKGLALDKLGLEPAEYSVTYTVEGGETFILEIGKKLEDKNEFYARSNKLQFLFTVGDEFIPGISTDVKSLFVERK